MEKSAESPEATALEKVKESQAGPGTYTSLVRGSVKGR